MRTLKIAAFAIAIGLGMGACTRVNSGQPTTQNVTGEAWYVKETGLGFLVFSTSIWYCPATAAKGPATCTKAIVHEPGAAPAAPAALAAPAAPAAEAPAAPAVDAPAAEPPPETAPGPAASAPAKGNSNYKPRK